MGLSLAIPARAADERRVAIVAADGRSPMVARLRAELSGVGLVPVVVIRRPVEDNLAAVAEEVDVVAVFGIQPEASRLRVWVIDHETGEEMVRDVELPGDGALSASVVGTQAVETLRASLLQLHEDDAPAPSTSVSTLVGLSEAQGASESLPRVHHIQLSVGGLFGAEGVPLVQLRGDYVFDINALVGLALRLDGSLSSIAGEDVYGKARMWLAHAVVGPRLSWVLLGRSKIHAGLGVGVALTHVNGVSSDPLVEGRSVWSPAVVGVGELGVLIPLWMGERAALGLDITTEISVSDRVQVVQNVDGERQPLISWGPARGALWLGLDASFW